MYYNHEIFNIYYKKYGNGKQNLIILPGWGDNRKTFNFIINNLKDYFTIYTFDYPGFGKTNFPDKHLQIFDYAKVINDFLDENNINNPIIIGHSFGGKIAYAYAQNHRVDNLVLAAPSLIKPTKTLLQKSKIILYKLLKKINKYTNNKLQKYMNKLGSKDFQNSHGIMRRIMVCAVNSYYGMASPLTLIS